MTMQSFFRKTTARSNNSIWNKNSLLSAAPHTCAVRSNSTALHTAALSLALGTTVIASAQAQPKLPDAALVNQWLSQKSRSLDFDLGEHALGLVPSSPAALREVPRFRIVPATRGERPASVMLTEFLPPVGEQGKQGSCVAWASTYYSYTYQVARQQQRTAEELANPKYQFSPAFVYNQSPHGPDENGGGMQFADAFRALRERGAATMDMMPYDQNTSATKPDEATVEYAQRYKARQTGVLYEGSLRSQPLDLEKLKTFLADVRLPIVTGIPVFRDFQELSNVGADYVYMPTDPKKENLLGLHAITIIGYDDTKKAFRMVNSWGTNWGDKGFLWLHEDFLKSLSLEGWTQITGGFSVRPVGKSWGDAPLQLSKAMTLPLRVSKRVSLEPASTQPAAKAPVTRPVATKPASPAPKKPLIPAKSTARSRNI
jgi:hypothetical protein